MSVRGKEETRDRAKWIDHQGQQDEEERNRDGQNTNHQPQGARSEEEPGNWGKSFSHQGQKGYKEAEEPNRDGVITTKRKVRGKRKNRGIGERVLTTKDTKDTKDRNKLKSGTGME
jgi:hypothetical protein